MNPKFALHAETLFDTLADLVSINSVNPSLPGGPGESAIATYIGNYFAKHSIPHQFQTVFEGRPNVIARLEGEPGGSTLVLEAHMDTASTTCMTRDPFLPERQGNRLYGRGSCDTKGGLAAMIHVLRTLRETAVRRRATVIFVGTVDEEFGMRGAAKFVEGNGKADGAIVAEPTDLNTVVASKGILRWQLRVKGRAAHSSKPGLGISAITKMAKVLTAIEERFPAIFAQRYHPLLGSPTITVGVIRGGVQVNQVPDSCLVDIDRRLIPGETQETVWQDFERLIAELRAADRDLNVVMEPPTFANGPLETTTAHRIVQVVCKVSSGLRGPREVVGVPFGSDATALADAGIPCIILGPGSVDQAHAEEEYVDLDQVAAAAEIYAGAALEF